MICTSSADKKIRLFFVKIQLWEYDRRDSLSIDFEHDVHM